MHEEGAGHPSTSTTDEKIQQKQEMLMVDQFTIAISWITALFSSLVYIASGAAMLYIAGPEREIWHDQLQTSIT